MKKILMIKNFFRILNENKIKYAVLQSLEKTLVPDSDIDIVIDSKSKRKQILKLLLNLVYGTDWIITNCINYEGDCFALWVVNKKTYEKLEFDFCYNYSYKGIVMLNSAKLLNKLTFKNGIFIANKNVRIEYFLLKRILKKETNNRKYKDFVDKLIYNKKFSIQDFFEKYKVNLNENSIGKNVLLKKKLINKLRKNIYIKSSIINIGDNFGLIFFQIRRVFYRLFKKNSISLLIISDDKKNILFPRKYKNLISKGIYYNFEAHKNLGSNMKLLFVIYRYIIISIKKFYCNMKLKIFIDKYNIQTSLIKGKNPNNIEKLYLRSFDAIFISSKLYKKNEIFKVDQVLNRKVISHLDIKNSFNEILERARILLEKNEKFISS